MELTGIVLGGGKSRRMGGEDKTLLKINGETLVERAVKALRPWCGDIIIASNAAAKYRVANTVEVIDSWPDIGPLGGIHAGLAAAEHDFAMVVAGDMPFFSGRLTACLLRRRTPEAQIVIADGGRGPEPLCALYGRTCLPLIEEMVRRGVYAPRELLRETKHVIVTKEELRRDDVSENIFFNLNSAEDKRRWLGGTL